MAYKAEISRQNPTCFLFIIDQSGSMADPFGSGESKKKKADGVSDAINNLLRELTIRCAKDEGVRDYFFIGVIGFGATTGPAFSGPLKGKDLVAISLIAESPAKVEERIKKVEDGTGGLVNESIKFPVWFEPVANGGTPMCQAFGMASNVIQQFISAHPNCFPPIVIHLTDGESTDGDPTSKMQAITSMTSSDGNVLLFNCHLSSAKEISIAFPNSPTSLPDMYSRMLYENSSELTPYMVEAAKNYGFDLSPNSKGFVYNADLVLLIQVLDIGTRPSINSESLR